ncbi:hypothetical protein L1987_16220 [Smallanthus sonchifolius]|uniref:Uncharacterized protein n=1 Tax=Smallanthus sonchifolius TaxID=185202 RepID=A0ACB9J7L7_9ASTR|nr:hypothetical protein L1987_16220 [Smallanthus sonchifolius]
MKWEAPKTPTEIRSFLGLAGYYRRFIQDFLKIAMPLTALTQKAARFEWGTKQEEAFDILKDKLSHALILALPEGNDIFSFTVTLPELIWRHYLYVPSRANVVADALSWKERSQPIKVKALRLDLKLDLMDHIKEIQPKALEEGNIKKERMVGKQKLLSKGDDGIMRFDQKIWIPKLGDIQEKILDEAHKSRYSMHPGANKMYKDLRTHY